MSNSKIIKVLKNLSRLAFIVLAVAMSCLLISPKDLILAHSLNPLIKEYKTAPGNIFKDKIEFTNTSEKPINIRLWAKDYNPEKGEILESSKVFVKLDFVTKEVQPEETIEIPYTISIPSDIDQGSYFNILIVEELNENAPVSESTVGTKPAYGEVIAMNIKNNNVLLDQLFTENTKANISIPDKGIPELLPMKINYKFSNTTNFVFQPEGELRVIDSKGTEKPIVAKINTDKTKVYPGKEYSQQFNLKVWKISDLFKKKFIVTRTYSQYGNSYIENKISVELIELRIIFFVVSGLAALTILYIILKKTGVIKF